MSNPILTSADLFKEFRGQKIDRLTRLKYKIWFKASELNAIGGTNYTANLPGLMALIVNLQGQSHVPWDSLVGFDRDMMDALDCSTDYSNALASGAAVTLANATNTQNVKTLNTYAEDDLRKMDTSLKILLGRHAKYPQ